VPDSNDTIHKLFGEKEISVIIIV